jgi:hypothetical protein
MCQKCQCQVENTKMYSFQEYSGMYLTLGVCNSNYLAASKLYAEIQVSQNSFPIKNWPMPTTI